MVEAEWRHRLINGAYNIRAAGMLQADKERVRCARPGATLRRGFRDFRGSVSTSGRFALNQNWEWGWNATLVSDKMVLDDYSSGDQEGGPSR